MCFTPDGRLIDLSILSSIRAWEFSIVMKPSPSMELYLGNEPDQNTHDLSTARPTSVYVQVTSPPPLEPEEWKFISANLRILPVDKPSNRPGVRQDVVILKPVAVLLFRVSPDHHRRKRYPKASALRRFFSRNEIVIGT